MNNKFDKLVKSVEELVKEKPHLSVHFFCAHMIIKHSISCRSILPSVVLNEFLDILILLDTNKYVKYYITTEKNVDPKSNLKIFELHIYQ